MSGNTDLVATNIGVRWDMLRVWLALHPAEASHLKQIQGHLTAWDTRDEGDASALEGFAAELAGAELDASHQGYTIPGPTIAPVLLDDISGGRLADDVDQGAKDAAEEARILAVAAALAAKKAFGDTKDAASKAISIYVKVGVAVGILGALGAAAKLAFDASPLGTLRRATQRRIEDEEDRQRQRRMRR